jgi:hypothetical protein
MCFARATIYNLARTFFSQLPTMADAAILFDDIFDVLRVNPEGRKFDRGALGTSSAVFPSSSPSHFSGGLAKIASARAPRSPSSAALSPRRVHRAR